MRALWRDRRGQAATIAVLFLAFVGILTLAALGVGAAYALVAHTQAAADAAALAGAQQVLAREWRVGGRLVCTLVEVDPDRGPQRAWQVWDANLRLSNVQLQTASWQVALDPPVRPRRLRVQARVQVRIGALGIVGRPLVSWPVQAEAEVQQRCQNPLTGPVFGQPARPRPPGWPEPSAEWVWNFPRADVTAPSGWPVYFARVFDLPRTMRVTFHVAGDDDFALWVDGQEVARDTWPQVRSASVDLWRGPHAVVVEATNRVWPARWPNPAGMLLAAYDDRGQLLFASRGNPLSTAGRPQDPAQDWGSYSPPNPDWAVYADPFFPVSWVQGSGALAAYLQEAGFTPVGGQDLGRWLDGQAFAGRGARSLIVFAQDIVPDSAAPSPEANTPIRRFLDAGGSVLWVGDVPFYYKGLPGGNRVAWGLSGLQGVLGVRDDASRWTAQGQAVEPTPAGAGYGLGAIPWWWAPGSLRALSGDCWVQPLATAPNGGYPAWRASFWPNPPDCELGPRYAEAARRENAPGFVRLHDAGVDLSAPQALVSILLAAGQVLGWYPGQAP